MKAIIAEQYGGPEVLELTEVAEPQVGPNGVLVRVRATSVNPVDWKLRKGLLSPIWKLRFPVIWGADLSGVVEQVGSAVTLFKAGDEVYGFKHGKVAKTYRGTYAECVVVPENALARKPAMLSHEEAAALPVAALTAWQVFAQANLQSGQHVLVQAASGGVGVVAVQIAKALGAHVAATAGSRNQDFLRRLGADEVFDYTKEKFDDRLTGYDLVLDGVGRSVWKGSLKVLKRGGRLITLAVPIPEEPAAKLTFFTTVLGNLVPATAQAVLSGKKFSFATVKPRGGDLEKINELIESGKLRPVIERIFPLEQIAEAHRLSESGHVRGKLVVKID